MNMLSITRRPSAVCPRDQDDPHDDAYPEGRNSAKRQNTYEHGTIELGGSSSGLVYESEPGPSTSGYQVQTDDFDFWTNSYAIDDDVILNEKVSKELVDEMSQTVDEAMLRKMIDEMLRQQCTSGDEHHWNCPPFLNHDDDDDDEDYTIAITPEEPDNSLSMRYEHLDTIPATESDEVIKSSVEDLVPILSESKDIPTNTCDVPFRDNSPPLVVSEDQFKEFSDSNNDSTSIDVDYFSIDNIDYIELSPPDSELIKSLNDSPTPGHVLKSLSPLPIPVEDSDSFLEKFDTSLSYSDNSLPEFETFSNHTEETNSGKPRVFVPNVLTTHPTLMLDLDFIPFDNSLPESKIFYFDIKEKNHGITTIHVDISLPDLECFQFKREPEPDELTSIVDSRIRENVLSAINVNLPPEDDHSPLFAYVVWIFLSFLTCISSEWNSYEIQCLSKPLELKSDGDFIFHYLPRGLMNAGIGSS
nr:hypothetical protein [Tanacetum cinerariifolium]